MYRFQHLGRTWASEEIVLLLWVKGNVNRIQFIFMKNVYAMDGTSFRQLVQLQSSLVPYLDDASVSSNHIALDFEPSIDYTHLALWVFKLSWLSLGVFNPRRHSDDSVDGALMKRTSFTSSRSHVFRGQIRLYLMKSSFLTDYLLCSLLVVVIWKQSMRKVSTPISPTHSPNT